MKKEELFDAIGDIEDEYIEEAHKEYVIKKKRKIVWRNYVSVVAGLAALFAVTVLFAEIVKDMPGTEKEEAAKPQIEEEVAGNAEGGYEGDCETAPECGMPESEAEAPEIEENISDSESLMPDDKYGEIKYDIPEALKDIYGGMYKGKDGKVHCIITEDTKENRELFCKECELDENDVIFEKGNYSFMYLIELKGKISNSKDDGKLPNLISYEIVETGNHILVQVKKETEQEKKVLEKLDTIGGAIMVEVVVEEEPEDVTVKNSSSYNPEEDFSFSLTWGCYGFSSYDSKTGKLIKTTDATKPEDYVTDYQLTDEDKVYFKNLLSSLDVNSYPDEYDPKNGKSAPSMTLILTANIDGVQKTIKAEDISLSYKSRNKKGQRFLSVCEAISDRLTATKAWKALPDYENFYD